LTESYYDEVADVFCVIFEETAPHSFKHIGPVTAVFSESGKILEIEISNAKKFLPPTMTNGEFNDE